MHSTPHQSSHSSIEAMQWQTDVEDQESGSYERLMVTQEEESRKNVQEVDDEINQNWTAVYQWTAKKMLRNLEDSESLKVSLCLQTSQSLT